MEREVEGKVAFVTGASRGIGKAIAVRLAAAGARVAVIARTLEDGSSALPGSLLGTVRTIQQSNGTAVAVVADLSKSDDRRAAVEVVQRGLGPIDILVNNAAVTFYEPFAEFRESRFRLMFELHVRAPFELGQLVVPGMRSRGAGSILNISSPVARDPDGPPYVDRYEGSIPYGMFKAAIERFTTGLAAELSVDGVAVNCLSPAGVVLTPGLLAHGGPEAFASEVQEPVEYMAEAALALCAADPGVLTGRVVYAAEILEELGIDVNGPARS